MLEDILLLEEKHINAAHQIISRIDFSDKEKRLIIAVSGESGSGKSELAHSIAKLLKKRLIFCKVIHSDDFYRISPKIRTEWRKSHPIEEIGISEYDWSAINRVIKGFELKEVMEMPCIDLLTDQIDTLRTNFGEISVLIIEGLYALHATADEKIFIDLTYEETKKARQSRGKEIQNEFRAKILQREHEVIQSLRSQASIIINKKYQLEA